MSEKPSKILSNNKFFLIIAIVIALIALWYFWLFLFSGDFFISHYKNSKNREALLKVQERIKVGDEYKKVLQIYWENDTEQTDLSLNAESQKSWAISMKPEILSTDWRIYIKFQDGKVTGYKIRTSDGPHPKDAPEDVGEADE